MYGILPYAVHLSVRGDSLVMSYKQKQRTIRLRTYAYTVYHMYAVNILTTHDVLNFKFYVMSANEYYVLRSF